MRNRFLPCGAIALITTCALVQAYAFASINYRLVPEATVEQQATDVANSVAYLRNNAKRLGIDSNRIVLMGRSAGAHLSALVGTDLTQQKALSPIYQAASPNSPAFLIVHVERKDGARQSAALADALRKNGTKVQLQAFKGKGLKGHAEINRKLGEPDYPATPVVNAWLRGVFGS